MQGRRGKLVKSEVKSLLTGVKQMEACFNNYLLKYISILLYLTRAYNIWYSNIPWMIRFASVTPTGYLKMSISTFFYKNYLFLL